MFTIKDHPDIESTLKTGYPTFNQPEWYYCQMCNEELNQDEVYEDLGYDYLCENCLLKLHKKVW